MANKDLIIKHKRAKGDDFEIVMTECMEDIESNHNRLASVKPLL